VQIHQLQPLLALAPLFHTKQQNFRLQMKLAFMCGPMMKVHGKDEMVPEEKFPLQSVASRNMQDGELCGTNISSAKGCEPPFT
jgi:hypothetical protein